MSNNITYNIINDNDKIIINKYVTIVINDYFNNLNFDHKKLLIKYLNKVCVLLGIYFYNEDLTKQLELNNFQDIFGLIVLLLPYFDLNESKTIKSLDEIYYNKSRDNILSTFYIDHDDNISVEEYLKNSVLLINKSFKNISNKLLPNWLNIFPFTMENYKESTIYKNFKYKFDEENFELYNDIFIDDKTDIQNNIFLLGYDTLYGTIKKFLYDDIKDIKWMIFDVFTEKEALCPTIINLGEMIPELRNIANEPWKILSNDQQNILNTNWISIINEDIGARRFINIKSLVYYYLRFTNDEDKLPKMSSECLKIIKKNINKNIDNEDQDDKDIEDFTYKNRNSEIINCIKSIINNIKFEDIYNYIYKCIQQFKYTWYGYVCLDENKKIINFDSFKEKYINNKKFTKKIINDYNINYITPKIFYNYFKSLLHNDEIKNKYFPLNNNEMWDNLTIENKNIFIDRLNHNNIGGWFNIRGNIKRLLYFISPIIQTQFINEILLSIITTNYIVDIIIETLVYNGILTYFKFNPKITDKSIIPDKNKDNDKWKKYFDDNVEIEPYLNGYLFFDNKQYGLHTDFVKNIIGQRWFTNFGADWIAQIQQFHHYINQRTLFITGGTGAGKSTIAPFMLVYALKIINYNNNGKVYCTQPRIQPVKDNATRIAKQLGIPFKEENIKEDGKNKQKFVKSDIDYIQYQYAEETLTDDLYHPCLRLYTDGLLYQSIKNNYVFKQDSIISEKKDKKEDKFNKKNICDIILVDEAHEHNTYMDMILTLSKFGTYINNQITLGIISATMEDDEKIYRKYFQPIDDNYKFPLDMDYLNYKDRISINRNLLDRRIHLSVPFVALNFHIDEHADVKEDEYQIVQTILSNKGNTGDILIFEPGSGEINKLIEKINNDSTIAKNILAIPFYSEIPKETLDRIKEISKPDIRKSFIYPRKYNILVKDEIPKDELLAEGTYTRFIIIATNIAEASITIDTLTYVIDTGTQKINKYDIETNQEKLVKIPISTPNRKQRKGRVGRVKPGVVYYTYDINTLSEKVIYKICIENITDKILELLSNNTIKIFDKDKDPYLSKDINNIPNFIRDQYGYINENGDLILYDREKLKEKFIIIYPNEEGKYNAEILQDNDGHFYIIHPNEDDFTRDDNLNIIERNKSYVNKVKGILDFNVINGILNKDYSITTFGNLIINLVQFFGENFKIEYVFGIIDLIKFNYNIDYNPNPVFKNYILYIVFSTNRLNIKLSSNAVVNSDFLAKAYIIPDKYYNLIDINDVESKDENILDENILDEDVLNKNKLDANKELTEIDKNIESKVTDLLDTRDIKNIINNYIKTIKNVTYDEMNSGIRKLLIEFYKIKIRIQILVRPDKLEKFKNHKNLRKFKYEDITKHDIVKNNIIKSLNFYEQSCYFITNYSKNKLLYNIPGVSYYINYFNRNINNLYQIGYNKIEYPNGKSKRFYYTNVDNNFRNNIIFYLTSDDDNKISEIIWIPENIISTIMNLAKLNNIVIPITKNIILNKELDKQLVIDEKVYKKIDIIIKYINNY